jgi:death on curing protein
MKKPVWVLREVVSMLHEQSLAQFGGSAGIRDEGLLDSALGKPENLFAYGNQRSSISRRATPLAW